MRTPDSTDIKMIKDAAVEFCGVTLTTDDATIHAAKIIENCNGSNGQGFWDAVKEYFGC